MPEPDDDGTDGDYVHVVPERFYCLLWEFAFDNIFSALVCFCQAARPWYKFACQRWIQGPEVSEIRDGY